MTNPQNNPDISVRGGIINVPHSTTPNRPPRHQPDTPQTKKLTKTKPDHKLHSEDPPPTITKSQPPPPGSPVPPPDEPETDSPE